MDPFGPKALICATAFASALAYRAVKKQSLTRSGAVVGFMVGFVMVATGLRGMTLFFFYQIGSWATKYKQSFKATLDETIQQTSVRGPGQVLAVSITAVSLSLYHAWYYGPEQTLTFEYNNYNNHNNNNNMHYPSALAAAILAHHAVCLGDTLASEMSMAFQSSPSSSSSSQQQAVRLVIPPFSKVPPGTNGGVTVRGTVWSILGGALCSMFHLAMDAISGILPPGEYSPKHRLWEYGIRLILFGAVCGGLGSYLDSVLGATVQMTYWDEQTKQVCHHPYHEEEEGRGDSDGNKHGIQIRTKRKHIAGWVPWLSNEGVNFVSVLITTILGGWVLGPMLLR